MKYLLDSDWVIDYLGGVDQATNLVRQLSDRDGVAISIVTYGEVYEGIIYGRDPQTAAAVFERFLDEVPTLAPTPPIMREFARLRGSLRRSGRGLADGDLMIAATALRHGLTLVSRNLRHYDRIEDLNILAMDP